MIVYFFCMNINILKFKIWKTSSNFVVGYSMILLKIRIEKLKKKMFNEKKNGFFWINQPLLKKKEWAWNKLNSLKWITFLNFLF